MKKLLMLTMIAASLAMAQIPSGLLTGPVSYVSSLTAGNPYGDTHVWTLADGTTCSAAGTPSCYIVKYVVGTAYSLLVASDGTGNCYSWDVWQLSFGPCQTSFHGNGGNTAALYCGATASSDMNGVYNLNCQATWDGTAPYQTVYTINVNIRHHTVTVMIPTRYGPRPQNWQQIDSMTVGVTPQPGS